MSNGAEEATPKVGVRAVLRIKDFRRLWLAQAISDFGDSLASLALFILLNKLTGSTVALAGLAVVLLIPRVTFGLVAGVYVDRLNRRQIMIISDLIRGGLVLGFGLVNSPGQVWLVYLLAFLQATVWTFFTPA